MAKTKEIPRIAKVARCIFPGPRAVLAAYDHDDKMLVGLTVRTKEIAKWALKGVSAADRRTMEREVRETHGE